MENIGKFMIQNGAGKRIFSANIGQNTGNNSSAAFSQIGLNLAGNYKGIFYKGNSDTDTDTSNEGPDGFDDPTTLTIDGEIGASAQGSTGDCWAMAGINATAGTIFGKERIKEAISQNPENEEVTVHLEGPDKTYTFTRKQVEERQSVEPSDDTNKQQSISRGDDDVKVLEMAFEEYRKENKLLPDNNPLNGGDLSEAPFLLTGVEPTYLDKTSPLNRELTNFENAVGIKSMDDTVDDYLDLIKSNPSVYSGIVGFKNEDQTNNILDEHAYNIKGVTIEDGQEKFILGDPQKAYVDVKVTREDLLKNYSAFAFSDYSNQAS